MDYKESAFGQACVHSAKVSQTPYVAPELHQSSPEDYYDAFLVDVFALGVTVFCMATTLLPWRCALPDDRFYSLFRLEGYERYLADRRTHWNSNSKPATLLSKGLMEVTEALMQPQVMKRSCLGETRCWLSQVLLDRDPVQRSCLEESACWLAAPLGDGQTLGSYPSGHPSVWDLEWLS